MAKQAKKPTVVAEAPVETKETMVKTVIKDNPIVKETKNPSWEIKDRHYYLKGNMSPLSYAIQSRHGSKKPLLYFDEEQGAQRELRYATNQNSPFADEQKGEATLGRIVFRDGSLFVPKTQPNLQKLLSLYHPSLNKVYTEFDAVEKAADELDSIHLEFEAMTVAMEMDIDQAEAVLRVEIGSKVGEMSSKELRRDLLMFAKKKASLFLELANDENVELRNVAIRATEVGIIKLSPDQRTFTWGTNDRKLMTVPFDESPYSAMAAYFKTDEGMEIFRSIGKKLQ